MPQPTDCGWFSGRHCEIIHINDKRGEHIIVTCQRVDD